MSLTALLFSILFLASCVMALARGPVYGLLAYVAVFYLKRNKYIGNNSAAAINDFAYGGFKLYRVGNLNTVF